MNASPTGRYEFGEPSGEPSLEDVHPLEGGVPIRHVPNATRLTELIGTPEGFTLWAEETLGAFEAEREALAGLDVAGLHLARNTYLEAETYEERVAPMRQIVGSIGLNAAAPYLGTTAEDLLNDLRRGAAGLPLDTTLEVERALAQGMGYSEAGRWVGLTRGVVHHVAQTLGRR